MLRKMCTNGQLTGGHVRLQVLTPLSLLINIATLMVCTFILDPNLGMFHPSAAHSGR